MDFPDGQTAAYCALNLITQVRETCDGNLDQIKSVIELGGFVNSDKNFTEQADVINGASDLMYEVFGEKKGKHARVAVSSPSLPLGAALEIEGILNPYVQTNLFSIQPT